MINECGLSILNSDTVLTVKRFYEYNNTIEYGEWNEEIEPMICLIFMNPLEPNYSVIQTGRY